MVRHFLLELQATLPRRRKYLQLLAALLFHRWRLLAFDQRDRPFHLRPGFLQSHAGRRDGLDKHPLLDRLIAPHDVQVFAFERNACCLPPLLRYPR